LGAAELLNRYLEGRDNIGAENYNNPNRVLKLNSEEKKNLSGW
jgi:hypothetical protein